MMILLTSQLLDYGNYKSKSCNWRVQDVHPGDRQRCEHDREMLLLHHTADGGDSLKCDENLCRKFQMFMHYVF